MVKYKCLTLATVRPIGSASMRNELGFVTERTSDKAHPSIVFAVGALAASLLLCSPARPSGICGELSSTTVARTPDEIPSAEIHMVRLDQTDAGTHRHTRVWHPAKTDIARALDQFSALIRQDPMDDDAYFRRGIAYFYAGFPRKALADFQMANHIDPDYPYYPLWLDIVGHRIHQASGLAEAASHLDMGPWPSPVIRLFLGQLSAGAVLSAARESDTAKKKEQMCEANFYIGVLTLQQGAKDEAARRFQRAVTDCPLDFVEAPAARAELKALGLNAR